jgi:divalent metal cation (Fe/Co/Zn/Cd) transporter
MPVHQQSLQLETSAAMAFAASAGESVHRAPIVARGLRLGYLGLAYNFLEATASLVAGISTGSVSLIGFGADATVEFTSSLTAVWRLHRDTDVQNRERLERRTLRITGASLVILACYVAWEAIEQLRSHEAPEGSALGIAVAVSSLLFMPWLASVKRQVARQLDSGALWIEARQTSICAWLAAILLGGLLLNATFGWWWADAAAALVMSPLIAREGVDGMRGRNHCGATSSRDHQPGAP